MDLFNIDKDNDYYSPVIREWAVICFDLFMKGKKNVALPADVFQGMSGLGLVSGDKSNALILGKCFTKGRKFKEMIPKVKNAIKPKDKRGDPGF